MSNRKDNPASGIAAAARQALSPSATNIPEPEFASLSIDSACAMRVNAAFELERSLPEVLARPEPPSLEDLLGALALVDAERIRERAWRLLLDPSVTLSNLDSEWAATGAAPLSGKLNMPPGSSPLEAGLSSSSLLRQVQMTLWRLSMLTYFQKRAGSQAVERWAHRGIPDWIETNAPTLLATNLQRIAASAPSEAALAPEWWDTEPWSRQERKTADALHAAWREIESLAEIRYFPLGVPEQSAAPKE